MALQSEKFSLARDIDNYFLKQFLPLLILYFVLFLFVFSPFVDRCIKPMMRNYIVVELICEIILSGAVFEGRWTTLFIQDEKTFVVNLSLSLQP